MKKIILSMLAALALAVGGVAAATPAQAANNWVMNSLNSTCAAQYKNNLGTTYTLLPGQTSSGRSVLQVRVPYGCGGSIERAGDGYAWVLTGGAWKNWMFPAGSAATIYSWQL